MNNHLLQQQGYEVTVPQPGTVEVQEPQEVT